MNHRGFVVQLAHGTARLILAGARPSVEVIGVDELPGKANYLLGNDPAQWRTGIPTFAKVRYRQIYAGVDLVFHGNEKQLEFDFELGPGADPAMIQLELDGNTEAERSDTGDLVIRASEDQVRLRKPVAYQGGTRILARYRLEGRRITFEIGAHDRRLPLVIDPVLEYSTFLGGSKADRAPAVATDRAGNVYLAGNTSKENPAPTPGMPASFNVAFVSKFNPSRNELVYTTYLGGTGRNFSGSGATGIAVDETGNAYVSGGTGDFDFPNLNAAQQVLGGRTDAFVAKLNALGGIVYSTFVGGPQYDYSRAIAVDRLGRAYIVGDFPAVYPLQGPRRNNDGFIARLNSDGNALEYSTQLGGSGSDGASGIAVDREGNAYITGDTSSSDFPVRNAIQSEASVAAVYRTGNGGSSWERAGSGLPTTPSILAIDSQNPSTLYAEAGGLYRSTNAGAWWEPVPLPGGRSRVATLVTDPSGSGTLYASSRRDEASDPPGAFYKSTDSGATWKELDLRIEGYVGADVTAIAIDPSNSSRVYAGHIRKGVFKSADGGETWSPTRLEAYVGQLIVDPDRPSILYALSILESVTVVFKSTDGGENWSPAGPVGGNTRRPVASDNISRIAYDKQSRVLYASTLDAILKSADAAATWEEVYRYCACRLLTLGPGDPAVIYTGAAGAPGGLIKSTDGGTTWVNAGIDMSVAALTTHPSQPDIVYAATPPGSDIFLAKLNSNGGALIYATYLGGAGSDHGVAVAIDSEGSAYVTGRTNSHEFLGMKPLPPPQGEPWWGDAFVVKVNPKGTAVLYAKALGGTGDDAGQAITVDAAGNAFIAGQTFSADFPTRNAVQAANPGTLYKSADGGTTWSNAGNGQLRGELKALAVHPSIQHIAYAGGSSGVYKTEDGGATWQKTGLTERDIETVVLDPHEPSTVWASGASGVFRSADGGATWERADNGIGFRQLVIDPEQSSTLYAGLGDSIFKTTDRGRKWTVVGRGLASYSIYALYGIYALGISSRTPPDLYAVFSNGVYGGFVMKSSDRGTTWTRANVNGLEVQDYPGEQVTVAVDPTAVDGLYIIDVRSLEEYGCRRHVEVTPDSFGIMRASHHDHCRRPAINSVRGRLPPGWRLPDDKLGWRGIVEGA
jgi:photosystem II stability/assembly factor-like uncharacterized protein